MMNALFPKTDREFKLMRWLNISLRTLHIIGISGTFGGVLFSQPLDIWNLFFYLALASGVGLVLLETWSNGIWFIQLRGLAIIVKLVVLVSIAFLPQLAIWALILVIVISGVFSHAPAKVRYYSVFHGRRVDKLESAE